MPATQSDRIDGLTTSVAVKAPVKAATTGPLTFVGSAPTGYQTIDGIACTDNIGVTDGLPDRVLVKNQVDTTQNGIYLVSSTGWARALDFDGARDALNGTLVPVIEGTQGGTFWMCEADDTKGVVFGTSAISFRAWPYGWGNSGGGGGTRGTIILVRDVVFRYDNGGVEIQPGVLGDLQTHFDGTIVGWTIIADQVGAIQLDLWKKAYAEDVPPTVANTIVAAAPPAILAGHESKSSAVLTGWTTAVASGQAWRINCASCATITRFTLILQVQQSLTVALS